MKIRKNDNVLVIAGKDKGKKGKVHSVYLKKERVLVEGINLIKKHARVIQGATQGGIIEQEKPIHVSNVMLVCSRCNQPTRVAFRFLEGGKKVRVCRHCHEVTD
ncbi:MAG: 50S ribosomal protein L24 [Dehalococcoidales bacterium]|nr:50S ribosomal protein L24 [Dehalococcoidales bacterium]